MKYLEDTLAEQCLSKTLYPNTKIHVRRKKVEGTLMTYTNELEVEVDFSDVDPNLLDQATDTDEKVSVLASGSDDGSKDDQTSSLDSDLNSNQPNLGLGDNKPKPTIAGRAARFFRKKD